MNLVSIIIPTFNKASLAIETLKSIVAQTYVNWECIVVDDGSTDNTQQTITTYSQNDNRFQFYKRPKNLAKGANSCRNYGFTFEILENKLNENSSILLQEANILEHRQNELLKH